MDISFYDRVDRYLQGKLSSEERARFEDELAADNSLADELRIYRAILLEVDREQTIDDAKGLLQTLKKLNAQYFNEDVSDMPGIATGSGAAAPQTQTVPGTAKHQLSTGHPAPIKKLNFGVRTASAAAVLAIIALAVTWYSNRSNPAADFGKVRNVSPSLAATPEKKSASRNYNPAVVDGSENIRDTLNNNVPPGDTPALKPGVPSAESPSANSAATLFAANFRPDLPPADKAGPLQNAYADYENEAYDDALAGFENANLDLVARGTTTERRLMEFNLAYYKAMSYLAVGRPNATKAISTLNTALSIAGDGTSRAKVLWYLALAYLKAGELKQSKVFLKQVADLKVADYSTKAQRLGEQLKG